MHSPTSNKRGVMDSPIEGRDKAVSARAVQPPLIVALRTVFRVLGVIAPGVAARLAHYLWFRPQRHTPPAREQALLMQARCHPRTFGMKRVSVYTWGAGPAVLLVHGWSGRGAQLAEFVTPLVDAGYRVVTFDAPGHGRSDGHETSLLEVAEIIRSLAHEFAPMPVVIAHSFGVACALYALQSEPFARRFVALSPPATMTGLLQKFAVPLGLSRRTIELFRAILARRFGDDLWDRLSAATMARTMALPALVIHDRDDLDVPWTEGEAVANAWPGARFIRTEGLGHRRLLRHPAVIARVVEFIGTRSTAASRLPPALEEVS